MPFAADFDDVYAAIKTTVQTAFTDPQGRCFRLDESRPAGRITDRLLAELRSATICVADLTENKPNVMWELGYAMALQKPTIIITQNVNSLPFDIKDMQGIEYSRNRLNATLAGPLKQSLLDTLGMMSTRIDLSLNADAANMGAMLSEISQLKHIIAEAVSAWKSDESSLPQSSKLELQALAGHWFNTESGSHLYSRIIRGELVSPYCYGDNSQLTGVYFGWRRIGEYWFARYQWINANLSGFTFLKMESLDKMNGAWWSSEDETNEDNAPPRNDGVPAHWIKQAGSTTLSWAEDFFCEVEEEGLASLLAKRR